jgi:hypothetical protein
MKEVGEEDTKLRYRRSSAQDLELWKHHASFGGEDKNRMVTITTWLLGFSAAIFWYAVTKLPLSNSGDALRIILISILGISISVFAAYISLLFSGYANQNWEKADEIASERHWCDLLPDHFPTLVQRQSSAKEKEYRWKWIGKITNWIEKRVKWLAEEANKIGRRFAKPCYTSELAPVFLAFLSLCALSFLVHFVILFLALITFAISPTESPICEVF